MKIMIKLRASDLSISVSGHKQMHSYLHLKEMEAIVCVLINQITLLIASDNHQKLPYSCTWSLVMHNRRQKHTSSCNSMQYHTLGLIVTRHECEQSMTTLPGNAVIL